MYEGGFLWDSTNFLSTKVCTNSQTLQQMVGKDHIRVEGNHTQQYRFQNREIL
jgi:hypothetical protein